MDNNYPRPTVPPRVPLVISASKSILAVTDLLQDESRQYVHDKAPQAGVHGQTLDDGPHQQHGEGALLHQLLHHHRQHFRGVHVLLPEAQVS